MGDGAASPRVLRPDCARCAALCCVGPAFARSTDFAIEKPAGHPCPNLAADFRCSIHAELRPRGFAGCAVFDCLGAGQRVVQETFGGADWRREPALAGSMFAAFAVMRGLHELLAYLGAALALPVARPLGADLAALWGEVDRVGAGTPAALAAVDLGALHARVNGALRRASALARAASPGPHVDHRGADLAGADMRAIDLRGADLRGALLIRADVRGVDLALADLTGADLRGANVAGADLSAALFMLPAQAEAAIGDGATRLPPLLPRPAHWATRRGSRTARPPNP